MVKEPHEGERYLELLGFNVEDFAKREIVTAKGTIQARDFLNVCGEHARPLLAGFESMSPDDPSYELIKGVLRDMIGKYVQGDAG